MPDATVRKLTIKGNKTTETLAVTLCPESKISHRKLDNVLKTEEWSLLASEERQDIVTALEVISSVNNIPGILEDLNNGVIRILDDFKDKLPEILKLVSYERLLCFQESIATLVLQVTQNCDEMILYCDVSGQERECKNLFQLKQTPSGPCCTFNSKKVGNKYVYFLTF